MANAISPAQAVTQICQWVAGHPSDRTVLIGIDGPGGAGKSTLADAIANSLEVRDVEIVHVDDFYLSSRDRPPLKEHGIDVDLSRLRHQIIEPLRRGELARYQRYDWRSDALAEWREVAPG